MLKDTKLPPKRLEGTARIMQQLQDIAEITHPSSLLSSHKKSTALIAVLERNLVDGGACRSALSPCRVGVDVVSDPGLAIAFETQCQRSMVQGGSVRLDR